MKGIGLERGREPFWYSPLTGRHLVGGLGKGLVWLGCGEEEQGAGVHEYGDGWAGPFLALGVQPRGGGAVHLVCQLG